MKQPKQTPNKDKNQKQFNENQIATEQQLESLADSESAIPLADPLTSLSGLASCFTRLWHCVICSIEVERILTKLKQLSQILAKPKQRREQIQKAIQEETNSQQTTTEQNNSQASQKSRNAVKRPREDS